MNKQLIKAHIEAHAKVLDAITEQIPETRVFKDYGEDRTFSLHRASLDDDGTIKALYKLYLGCGDWDYETVYMTADELFPDMPSDSAGDTGCTGSGPAQS